MKRLIITMLFALFVTAFPAMAQDVTPARLSEETTTTQEAAPTVEATQAAPVIVNVEAPSTPAAAWCTSPLPCWQSHRQFVSNL